MQSRIIYCGTMFLLNWVMLAEVKEAVPQFKDYPVQQIYRGRPALPVLSNKGQRLFRTRIRQGAKMPVEFAGYYTVPNWGCGTSCDSFVIVDSRSGKVYDPPFSVVGGLSSSWLEQHVDQSPERVEFHPNSRLLKINGCPEDRNCGFYDYVMKDGKGLELIRKELLPKEFQREPEVNQ